MTDDVSELSLHRLLAPEVLADPYPLYHRLRREAPVHWDPYLHAWVVTRYGDVADVLTRFSAVRTPPPDKLVMLGLRCPPSSPPSSSGCPPKTTCC
ncbi:hypothetical protein ACIBI9_62805 [Nonomuraea sp. NPDC050451]|uniref:hypothetical protein n=1 Tax=Nonomuraea sp. NPDC050451 TaxID=3364364 RepID=UPI0037927B57